MASKPFTSSVTISAGMRSGAFAERRFPFCINTGWIKERMPDTILLPLMQPKLSLMIDRLIRKLLPRLLFFIIISFPLKLVLDVIFGLIYRNYQLIRPVEEYLGSMVITVAALESVIFFKHLLGRKYPWDRNPLKRLVAETGFNTLTMSFIITALSLSVNYLILNSRFVIFTDELIRTVYYLIFLVVLPAFIEFAVFLLRRWQSSLVEMEKYKKENAEYKFETLRTQVNPHFLFNSLNTLSALVYEDREKAAGFIRELSDVYRYVLDNRSRDTTPLKEEVNFIRSFVYLYQLRFDNKLHVEISIAGEDLERLIAPMTLQMLVENAVKHNIVSGRKPLTISIRSEADGTITVRNNLQKKNAEADSSEIGLKNICSRYGYLTNKPVIISETETEFIVKVPLI